MPVFPKTPVWHQFPTLGRGFLICQRTASKTSSLDMITISYVYMAVSGRPDHVVPRY